VKMRDKVESSGTTDAAIVEGTGRRHILEFQYPRTFAVCYIPKGRCSSLRSVSIGTHQKQHSPWVGSIPEKSSAAFRKSTPIPMMPFNLLNRSSDMRLP